MRCGGRARNDRTTGRGTGAASCGSGPRCHGDGSPALERRPGRGQAGRRLESAVPGMALATARTSVRCARDAWRTGSKPRPARWGGAGPRFPLCGVGVSGWRDIQHAAGWETSRGPAGREPGVRGPRLAAIRPVPGWRPLPTLPCAGCAALGRRRRSCYRGQLPGACGASGRHGPEAPLAPRRASPIVVRPSTPRRAPDRGGADRAVPSGRSSLTCRTVARASRPRSIQPAAALARPPIMRKDSPCSPRRPRRSCRSCRFET